MSAPYIFIPSKEEVKAEILAAKETLEKYGVADWCSCSPTDEPIDWAGYFEGIQKQLNDLQKKVEDIQSKFQKDTVDEMLRKFLSVND